MDGKEKGGCRDGRDVTVFVVLFHRFVKVRVWFGF